MKEVEAITSSGRMPIVREKLRQRGIGGMTFSALDKGEKVIV